MIEVLDEYSETEKTIEMKWKTDWTEKVQRIRAAF